MLGLSSHLTAPLTTPLPPIVLVGNYPETWVEMNGNQAAAVGCEED